ncbi:hypothetical protein HDU67_000777 [Dinochytrium kinnereticum]|nr:hypothetical protein HDU67_000777 [Dinochytrium kinnereticum]
MASSSSVRPGASSATGDKDEGTKEQKPLRPSKSLTAVLGMFGPPVRQIDLSGNSLSGVIPSSIADHIMNLKILNLSRNNFEDTIPESYGNFTALKIFNISMNQMDGMIPDSIWKLQALEVLDLSGNNFHGPVPEILSRLKKLAVLITQRQGSSTRVLAETQEKVNTNRSSSVTPKASPPAKNPETSSISKHPQTSSPIICLSSPITPRPKPIPYNTLKPNSPFVCDVDQIDSFEPSIKESVREKSSTLVVDLDDLEDFPSTSALLGIVQAPTLRHTRPVQAKLTETQPPLASASSSSYSSSSSFFYSETQVADLRSRIRELEEENEKCRDEMVAERVRQDEERVKWWNAISQLKYRLAHADNIAMGMEIDDADIPVDPLPLDPIGAMAILFAPKISEDDLKRGAALKRLVGRAISQACLCYSGVGALRSLIYFWEVMSSSTLTSIFFGKVGFFVDWILKKTSHPFGKSIGMFVFVDGVEVGKEVKEMVHCMMKCCTLAWASSETLDIERVLKGLEKLWIIQRLWEESKRDELKKKPVRGALAVDELSHCDAVLPEALRKSIETERTEIAEVRKATMDTKLKLSTLRHYVHWNPMMIKSVQDEADADVGGVRLGADLDLLSAKILSKDGFCLVLETTRISNKQRVAVKVLCGSDAEWEDANVRIETLMLREAKKKCEHVISFVGLCTLPESAPWVQCASDFDEEYRTNQRETKRSKTSTGEAPANRENGDKKAHSMVDLSGSLALVFALGDGMSFLSVVRSVQGKVDEGDEPTSSSSPAPMAPPWRYRIKIMTDIVAAVAFLHACNMVHLNLSPASFWIDTHWNVRLLGLGSAMIRASKSETAPPPIAYLKNYAPATPTAKNALHRLPTEATDIYALGQMLFDIAGRKIDHMPPVLRAIMDTCVQEECLMTAGEMLGMLVDLNANFEEWDMESLRGFRVGDGAGGVQLAGPSFTVGSPSTSDNPFPHSAPPSSFLSGPVTHTIGAGLSTTKSTALFSSETPVAGPSSRLDAPNFHDAKQKPTLAADLLKSVARNQSLLEDIKRSSVIQTTLSSQFINPLSASTKTLNTSADSRGITSEDTLPTPLSTELASQSGGGVALDSNMESGTSAASIVLGRILKEASAAETPPAPSSSSSRKAKEPIAEVTSSVAMRLRERKRKNV